MKISLASVFGFAYMTIIVNFWRISNILFIQKIGFTCFVSAFLGLTIYLFGFLYTLDYLLRGKT